MASKQYEALMLLNNFLNASAMASMAFIWLPISISLTVVAVFNNAVFSFCALIVISSLCAYGYLIPFQWLSYVVSVVYRFDLRQLPLGFVLSAFKGTLVMVLRFS